jgi:acyl carrier protein
MKIPHCSVGTWLGFSDKAGRKRIDAVFFGREPLNDDAFYERYFKDTTVSKAVAVGVRRVFIDNILFDMNRLAPGDDFNEELNFVWHYDSLADVELICQIEKEFGIEISDADASKAFRLGDMIRIVDDKIRKKTANQSTIVDLEQK